MHRGLISVLLMAALLLAPLAPHCELLPAAPGHGGVAQAAPADVVERKHDTPAERCERQANWVALQPVQGTWSATLVDGGKLVPPPAGAGLEGTAWGVVTTRAAAPPQSPIPRHLLLARFLE